MKIKTLALLLVTLLCFSLTACGDNDPKRPIDYPNSTWSCDIANITFSVSKDCEITDATMVDINGETVSISLEFTDMTEGKVSIKNADGTETYISGTCTYDKDIFSVFVTDIYSNNFDISSIRLTFNRS